MVWVKRRESCRLASGRSGESPTCASQVSHRVLGARQREGLPLRGIAPVHLLLRGMLARRSGLPFRNLLMMLTASISERQLPASVLVLAHAFGTPVRSGEAPPRWGIVGVCSMLLEGLGSSKDGVASGTGACGRSHLACPFEDVFFRSQDAQERALNPSDEESETSSGERLSCMMHNKRKKQVLLRIHPGELPLRAALFPGRTVHLIINMREGEIRTKLSEL